MEKEEFLKRIFSIDTKAGYRLRYKITKATCCEEYKEEINFTNVIPHVKSANRALMKLFNWGDTLEGPYYWSNLYDILRESNL